MENRADMPEQRRDNAPYQASRENVSYIRQAYNAIMQIISRKSGEQQNERPYRRTRVFFESP